MAKMESYIPSAFDFLQFEKMLKKAQELFGPLFSKDILFALRRTSFVLQSRLEGNDVPNDEIHHRDASSGNANPTATDQVLRTNGLGEDVLACEENGGPENDFVFEGLQQVELESSTKRPRQR